VIAAGREFRAPMTIDASGRDAFLQSRTGWKVRDQVLNKIAVWTYYKGARLDAESMPAPPPSPIFLRRLVLVHPAS